MRLPGSTRSTQHTSFHANSDYLGSLFERAQDDLSCGMMGLTHAVNKEEQGVLAMLFRSIMSRCDPTAPGIDRKVFLQFFSLPVGAR